MHTHTHKQACSSVCTQMRVHTNSPVSSKVVRSNTCPVFIHCNEKQGVESGGEECAAARITAPTPTQTQCLTNTGNNESNNINTL